jgi:P-type Cu2+ transporter
MTHQFKRHAVRTVHQLVDTISAQPLETPSDARCLHCRTPIPPDAGSARYCCRGCEAVHSLLVEQGLDRYYALAGTQVVPVGEQGQRSHAWLEPLIEAAESNPSGLCSLQLDVQGIHCAACVWLMNETWRRAAQGVGGVTVNPSLGVVALTWKPGSVAVARWVKEIEAFGYQFGPARKTGTRKSIDLPLRLGISAALTINVMLFSVSFYFGLSPADPQVFRLFTWLSFAMSTTTVLIGGWPFIQAAVRGLRVGMLHLDLPIAMGVLLVYGMSVVQLITSNARGDLAYFDTLNTFITLMLLGRFLQERMLERNRRYLLDDDGADGILVRRVEGEALVSIAAPKVCVGDVLLIAPGDLIPVEAMLLEPSAEISTDWITGEGAPRTVMAGTPIPAGSFNAGHHAVHVRANTAFADSPLVALLRQPAPREGRAGAHQAIWRGVAKRWVVTVVSIAGLGFLAWLPHGLDRAVNVAVSLLVITCPCAIGLAIPLAYELTQTRLRRAGFYVRSVDLLDRLTQVRHVLFDKTGTLTLGRLEVDCRESLNAQQRQIAWNLAVRSGHPVSNAIARFLAVGAKYDVAASVHEVTGKGVEWARPDGVWRLGRADWAVGQGADRTTVLAREGEVVARFATREVLRSDARQELGRLTQAGYDVWLLSGDAPERVAVMAQTLGVEPSHAFGSLRPEDKAAHVLQIGAEHSLFLGDGVNDALAFEQALAAGTPAIDRPVMPGRSDFFLVGEGLTALHAALARSLHLRAVVKQILGLSILYNVLAISASLLGWMSPLAAAVSMPLSTLSLLVFTVLQLGRFERAGSAWTPAGAQLSRQPLGVTR